MTTYVVNRNTIVSHHLHIGLLHRRSKVHGLRQARQCTGPFAILNCPCRWTEYITGVLLETGIDMITTRNHQRNGFVVGGSGKWLAFQKKSTSFSTKGKQNTARALHKYKSKLDRCGQHIMNPMTPILLKSWNIELTTHSKPEYDSSSSSSYILYRRSKAHASKQGNAPDKTFQHP